VYVLQPLSDDDLKQIVARSHRDWRCQLSKMIAIDRLVAYADGDARRLLNTLETLAMAQPAGKAGDRHRCLAARVLGERMRRYDKGGEQFYDTISALHKSVRGSDPDAALYWLVRMLDGGADPRYMARRLVRMASEDIGLADPRALRLALDAAEVYERLGSPRANWRWPSAWSIWPWRPSPTRCTRPSTKPRPLSRRTAPARCPCTCAMRPRSS
jgi:putative ATPase